VRHSDLRKLFTECRAFYTLEEARRLAGVSASAVARAIEEGAVEPALPWEDVAGLALARWTPRRIAHIVGGALPPLNQFRTIRVELPVYQLRLLHYLAEQRSTRETPLAVSDVLEYELTALAFEEDVASLDRAIPGFAAAANFPLLQQATPAAAAGCVFCGADVDRGHDICPSCAARHVPPL
jgi:hypothetical protein